MLALGTAVVVMLVSAKPTFEDVLKKFPLATLPFTLKDCPELTAKTSAKLTAPDAEALGFLDDESDLLRTLRTWKQKPQSGEKKALWPIARVQRPSHQVLLVRYDDETPMAQSRETFLLSYDGAGQLLGGLTFHLEFSSEAGAATNVSTVDRLGVITRMATAKTPMHEAGLPEELVVTSEHRAKLTSKGTLEVMKASYSTKSGAFVDLQSKEELRIFGQGLNGQSVFYRGNDSKPFQALEGDGKTVRFQASPSPYVLTWDDLKSAISCQNAKGEVQLFTRQW